MLEKCLSSLLPHVSASKHSDKLVIVENDDSPHCKSLVDGLAARYPDIDLTYVLETDIGIPQARNRAMDVALAQQVDWLAFIDDDEIVEPGWLEAMRTAADSMGADALHGPTISKMPAKLPIWITPPKFRNKRRGQQLETAGTNNTMIRMDWLRHKGTDLRFDGSFRFSGGSDIDFFFRMSRAGGRITWVDDAIVSELMSLGRLAIYWQLRRAYSVALVSTYVHRKYSRRGILPTVARSVWKSATRLIRGIGQCMAGGVILLVNKSKGTKILFRGGKSLAFSIGTVLGLFAMNTQPYKTTVGH